MTQLSRSQNKLIALMPAYNEAEGIAELMDRIAPHVDAFIIVDDCSKDATVSIVKDWRRKNSPVYLIALPQNVGASGALKAGYLFVTHLLAQGALDPDDVIMEIDSDGQHDPKYIPELCQQFAANVDVVLARRDFSVYPRYKRIGNWGLTLIASGLSGFRYHDVESNYRFTRARVFPHLLEYFSGYRYSGAFEVGIILASLGYQIKNDFVIEVPFYREGARASDGLYVLGMGLRAWWRVRLRIKNSDLGILRQNILANKIES